MFYGAAKSVLSVCLNIKKVMPYPAYLQGSKAKRKGQLCVTYYYPDI